MNLTFAKILDNTLSVRDEAINFLISDGCLEQVGESLKITYKGRMRTTSKSFCHEVTQQRVMFVCAIVAALASTATLIFYIANKFCGG
jgi:hypothetical protein